MKFKTTLASLSLIVAAQASAHTLLIKPNIQNENPHVEILMTEKYFKGDRKLDSNKLATQFISSQGVEWLTKAQPLEQAKIIQYPLANNQLNGILVTNATPRYRGIKKGTPATSPESTLRIDDFAKTIIGSTPNNALATGQTIEIVPNRHPAKINLQDNLELQVLYKGEPISAKIKVIPPKGQSSRLTTDPSGKSTFTIDQKGIWLLKTAYKSSQGEDQFSSSYEAAASLLFEIK